MLNLEPDDFEMLSSKKFKQLQSKYDSYFIGDIRDCEEFIDEYHLTVFNLYQYEDAVHHYAILFNERKNQSSWD